MPPSWHPVPACAPRLCCRRAIPHCSSNGAASIPKSGPEIKNRCTQEAGNEEILASILKFGLEIKNRCTQEGLNGGKLTSIPKSGLEFKNQCTQEAGSEEILASILKFGLEIKNRCTKEGVNGEKLTSIPKFGPEIKNHFSSKSVLQAGHSSLRQRRLEPDAEDRRRHAYCRRNHSSLRQRRPDTFPTSKNFYSTAFARGVTFIILPNNCFE